MSYSKGSIIYFEGDSDDRVYILQKGRVVITTTDVETKLQTMEQVKQGEFFGVKSAIGHFPREETVRTLEDSICIVMTSQEFEALFSTNKQLIMKMLRVFSNQLRQIHKKTEAVLNKNDSINQVSGLFAVAKAFFDDGKWQSCEDVCKNYLRTYPTAQHVTEIKTMLLKSDAYVKRGVSEKDAVEDDPSTKPDSSIKLFELPAFKRFEKHYENGQVIITEFERGETFYLIQSGTVQLTKCVNESNKNLDILKPGEFFGEMAILDNSPRSATCVARGHVECLEFNKANFEMLITGNPQLALILLKLFCKRIYDQKRRLRILVISDPHARLADVFCMFDEMNPRPPTADRHRKFNVTESDIAHWSGLPFSVVKDELKHFTMSRKIEIFENYIIVNNIVDMRRIVETRADTKK